MLPLGTWMGFGIAQRQSAFIPAKQSRVQIPLQYSKAYTEADNPIRDFFN